LAAACLSTAARIATASIPIVCVSADGVATAAASIPSTCVATATAVATWGISSSGTTADSTSTNTSSSARATAQHLLKYRFVVGLLLNYRPNVIANHRQQTAGQLLSPNIVTTRGKRSCIEIHQRSNQDRCDNNQR
jgi:hypothetical protein